jgi:hypothetical protein
MQFVRAESNISRKTSTSCEAAFSKRSRLNRTRICWGFTARITRTAVTYGVLEVRRSVHSCICRNIFEYFIVFIEFGIDNTPLANIQDANCEDGAT